MNLDSILSILGNAPYFIGAIFGLGLSIFVHELGHFLAARKRGLRVTRFSIGMGPKLYSWEKDGVEYRISALPLGGYVALPQLADMGRLEGGKEGEIEETDNLPPISFLDKVIVSVMGAVFNFIFAFGLALILWGTGEPATNEMLTTQIGYVSESLSIEGETIPGPAYEAGIRAGDIILEIDDSRVETFTDIQQKILTGFGRNENGNPQAKILIERDGVKHTFFVQAAIAYYNDASKDPIRTLGIAPADELRIHSVSKDSPAKNAGLQPGDIIRSANGVELLQLQTFVDIISEKENTPTRMVVDRDGENLELSLNPITVALTRPVVEVKLERNGLDSAFSVRPDYAKTSTEDKTDPMSKSSLFIHQIIADNAGILEKLRHEDRIVAINNKAVESLQDVVETFGMARDPVLQITIGRNEGTQTLPIVFSKIATDIKPPVTQQMVGFSLARDTIITHINPFKQIGQQIDTTVRILKALFHKGSSISFRHLSGPIGIVRVLTDMTKVDFRLAISFLILLNVNLGILNLLPIPILDGGHILIAIIGKIRRKALPIRLVASVQGAFMIMLLSLMVYIIFKDSVRWRGDNQQTDRYELMNKLYIEPVFISEE
jgi:regulator of sigma E protease